MTTRPPGRLVTLPSGRRYLRRPDGIAVLLPRTPTQAHADDIAARLVARTAARRRDTKDVT